MNGLLWLMLSYIGCSVSPKEEVKEETNKKSGWFDGTLDGTEKIYALIAVEEGTGKLKYYEKKPYFIDKRFCEKVRNAYTRAGKGFEVHWVCIPSEEAGNIGISHGLYGKG